MIQTESIQHKVLIIKIENSKILEQYFQLIKKLGEGTFGTVVSAIDKRDGTIWAVKKIVKSRKFRGVKKSWEKEFQILSKIQHPNIIKLKEMYESEHYAYLVLEYCDGFNLSRQLKKHGRFTEFETSHIIYQLSAALSYLHRRQIVHRDVKLENVFLRQSSTSNPNSSPKHTSKISSSTSLISTTATSEHSRPTTAPSIHRQMQNLFEVKLGDFGLAVELRKNQATMIEFCGTPMYMAPEIIAGKSYSRQCDVWSIGIIIFMLLTGEPPFKSGRATSLFHEIQHICLERMCKHYNLSRGAVDILGHLLHLDPAYRLSMLELFVHKWTTQSIKALETSSVMSPLASTNVLQMMKDYNNTPDVATSSVLTIDSPGIV